MAYTFAVSAQSVFGNERVIHGVVTTDATTGTVTTGLDNIISMSHAPKSMTSGVKYAINKLAAGTASAGTLAITGCTSGDELYITVYGT
jgi:hypothetical protein